MRFIEQVKSGCLWDSASTSSGHALICGEPETMATGCSQSTPPQGKSMSIVNEPCAHSGSGHWIAEMAGRIASGNSVTVEPGASWVSNER